MRKKGGRGERKREAPRWRRGPHRIGCGKGRPRSRPSRARPPATQMDTLGRDPIVRGGAARRGNDGVVARGPGAGRPVRGGGPRGCAAVPFFLAALFRDSPSPHPPRTVVDRATRARARPHRSRTAPPKPKRVGRRPGGGGVDGCGAGNHPHAKGGAARGLGAISLAHFFSLALRRSLPARGTGGPARRPRTPSRARAPPPGHGPRAKKRRGGVGKRGAAPPRLATHTFFFLSDG